MNVSICRLTREWSTYQWLCKDHQETRKRNRWTVDVVGVPHADLPCADCADSKYVVVPGQ